MAENNRISQNEQRLNVENIYLKGQIESLKASLSTSGQGITSVLNRGLNCLSEFQQNVVPMPSYPRMPTMVNPMAVTSGLVLMVVLFAFGMVFGSNVGGGLSGSMVRDADRFSGMQGFQPLSNPTFGSDSFNDPNLPYLDRMKQLVSDSNKLPAEMAIKKEVPVPVKQEPEPESIDLTAVPEVSQMVWKQNATYLHCPTVQRITPPKSGPWDENETEPYVVFLIPPSSLGNPVGKDSTLEVTCQVMNVHSVTDACVR